MTESSATNFVSSSLRKDFEEDDESREIIEVLGKFGFDLFEFVYDSEYGEGLDLKGYRLACEKLNKITPIRLHSEIKLSSFA